MENRNIIKSSKKNFGYTNSIIQSSGDRAKTSIYKGCRIVEFSNNRGENINNKIGEKCY